MMTRKRLYVPTFLEHGDKFIVKDPHGLHAEIKILNVEDDDVRVRIVPLDRPARIYQWEENWSLTEIINGFTAEGGRIHKMI